MTDSSPIAEVSEVKGSATVTHKDGSQGVLTKGSPIFEGDVIETGPDGSANILFSDDSSFVVSNNAKLSVDDFAFDTQTRQGESKFSVLRGLFVYTSGLVSEGDPDDVQINTPTGSIGIRGTIVAGDIPPEGSGRDTKISVIEGAIVVRDANNNEITLSQKFETVQVNSSGEMRNAGVLSASDMAASYNVLRTMAPGMFSEIDDTQAEDGAGDNNTGAQDGESESSPDSEAAPTDQDQQTDDGADAAQPDAAEDAAAQESMIIAPIGEKAIAVETASASQASETSLIVGGSTGGNGGSSAPPPAAAPSAAASIAASNAIAPPPPPAVIQQQAGNGGSSTAPIPNTEPFLRLGPNNDNGTPGNPSDDYFSTQEYQILRTGSFVLDIGKFFLDEETSNNYDIPYESNNLTYEVRIKDTLANPYLDMTGGAVVTVSSIVAGNTTFNALGDKATITNTDGQLKITTNGSGSVYYVEVRAFDGEYYSPPIFIKVDTVLATAPGGISSNAYDTTTALTFNPVTADSTANQVILSAGSNYTISLGDLDDALSVTSAAGIGVTYGGRGNDDFDIQNGNGGMYYGDEGDDYFDIDPSFTPSMLAVFSGGSGDDEFIIGASDPDMVFFGGAGDDYFSVTGSYVSNNLTSGSATLKFDGGSGYDILDFIDIGTVDFTMVDVLKIKNVEELAFDNTVANTVVLAAQDVFDISGSDILLVFSEGGDAINLTNSFSRDSANDILGIDIDGDTVLDYFHAYSGTANAMGDTIDVTLYVSMYPGDQPTVAII